MSIAAGKLRHRIVVQEYRYVSQNPVTGEEFKQWVDFHSCWAAIEPSSVREFVASQEKQSKVAARIVIRYVDGINAAMRILHVKRGVTRVYNIEGVLADKDSGLEYLTLPVSEGVSDGGQ